MKKKKHNEKKLSLNKLQIAKINYGLNSIKGGQAGIGGNDTVLDNTYTQNTKGQNGGIDN